MAARKSTRKRSRARSHRALRCGRLSRAGPGACAEPIRHYLDGVIRSLKLVMSVVTVAVGALWRQNADNDADVADVLERHASDRLDVEIEKSAELLDSLAEGKGRKDLPRRAA